MKIDVKKQLANMKIFIVSAIAIFSFAIFGKENILIGIGAVSTAASMYGENNTTNVERTIFMLALMQVSIGICSYIATINILLGYLITLCFSFIVYYRFSYELKTPKTVGFMMTYILLLYYKVDISQMPKRILALIFSAFVIMALYYILTKYNFCKVTNKQITDSIALIKKEINLMLEKKSIKEDNKNASILLKNIQINIYEVMEKSKNTSDYVYKIEIIVVLLKKINTTLSYIKEDDIYKDRLEKVGKILDDINLYILGKKSIEDIKNTFEKYYNDFELENIKSDLARYNYCNIELAIKESCRCIKDKSRKSKIDKSMKLKKKLKYDIDIFKNNFNMSSLRFNIAVKASILISSAVFVVDYLKIYEGKWIVLSIAVLLNPYAEQVNKKAKDRVEGTFVGAIAFGIIYLIVDKSFILISIVFFMSLYFALSTKKYNIRCIFTTMAAILAVKMLNPHMLILKLLEYRVLFVLIAAVVAWVVINLCFPYKVKNDMKSTIKKYTDFDKEIINAIHDNNLNRDRIEKIFIKNNYLWMRINYINKQIKSTQIEEFLSKQNDFFTNISFSILISGGIDKESDFVKKLLSESKSGLDEKQVFENYKEIFKSCKDSVKKSIVISLYRIYLDDKDINKLEGEIFKQLRVV